MYCFSKIINSLNQKEHSVIFSLIGVIIICIAVILIQPSKGVHPEYGGEHIEGIIGTPRYINPILAQTNDVDLDLVELIYSSLIYDLTDRIETSDDNKSYTLYLKQNIKWHDNEQFTANDVLFTIQLIQDPVYQSPLRINFQGVGIEKVNDFAVKFTLKDVYVPFLSALDIGILPKHIWQEISSQGFALAEANIRPIGNGTFKFKKLQKGKNGNIKSIYLESFNKQAYLKQIILKFYPNEQELLQGFRQNEIDSLGYISSANLDKLNNNLEIHHLTIPRYFAVFFNLDRIKDLKTRQVLAAAINRQEIINKVLFQKAKINNHKYNFEIENIDLSFELVTTDWPELIQTAEILKEQWQAVGAQVEIKIVDSATIQQDYIRPRNYDALLFGEVLDSDPDPFAFWHSSQKQDPGFNLCLYDNPKADKLLVEARQTIDAKKRKELYEQFDKLLETDLPAIFLYNPIYLYGTAKKIKNINLDKIALPSKRFQDIEEWHIK